MAASNTTTMSEYLKTAERAFEDAAAVPTIKSAAVESETQFTVIYRYSSTYSVLLLLVLNKIKENDFGSHFLSTVRRPSPRARP